MINKNLSNGLVHYTKKNQKYDDNMFAMQLNLNCYKENSNKPLAKYLLQEVDDYRVYTKSLAIFDVNVVKCNELFFSIKKKRYQTMLDGCINLL